MISVSAMLMALLPQISVCKYRTDIKVYRYITKSGRTGGELRSKEGGGMKWQEDGWRAVKCGRDA